MELPPEVLQTIKMTDFTAIVTLRADGTPHLVGAWNLLPASEGVLILSGERYVETRRNLARDPRCWVLVASRELDAGYRLHGRGEVSARPEDIELVRRYWPRCHFAIRIQVDQVVDLAYWKTMAFPRVGPAGPAGPAGATGPTGAAGSTGAAGPGVSDDSARGTHD